MFVSMFSMLLACGEKQEDTAVETETGEDTTAETESEVDETWLYEVGVSTLAGSGELVSTDGIGEQSSFAEPKALRLRSDGVLVVADSASGNIRLVSPDGTVQTLDLVGDVPVAPSGLAVTDNAIFVSDYEQHCILKIEGTVSSVFSGVCGEKGYQNGATALFENPRGLAINGEGKLLVADAGNNAIRSIGLTGEVTTIAGTAEKFVISSEGPALEANVYIPFGLAIHPDGDLFFSGFDHCIRRLHNGSLENVAGLCLNYGNTGTDDGGSIDARFDTPMDIAFTPDGRLLIADGFNDRIRVLSADLTTVSTLTGQEAGFQDGSLDEALFNIPRSVTVDDNGVIFVADSVNNRIRVIVEGAE